MEKSFDDIEDFLVDESFRSWATGSSPELDRQWEIWISENPDKADLLYKSKKLAQSLKFEEFQAATDSKQRILEKIRLETEQGDRKAAFILPYWVRVAAILVMGLGMSMLALWYNQDDQVQQPMVSEVDLVQKKNPLGVKSQHMLTDGSIVFLNSGSSLEYLSKFGSEERVVKLKGEAFFEVAHDANRPFRVILDGFEVEVLGTKFNVNTLTQQPTVALVEGSVRVNADINDEGMELEPGQMAIFQKERQKFEISSFDLDYQTGWKDGYLVFKEATFDEVIDKLHSWYGIGIEIRNKPSVSDWSYTAKFRNESMENVLFNMSTLRGFDYEIRNDSLILSF